MIPKNTSHVRLEVRFRNKCTPENDSDEILTQALMFGSGSPDGRYSGTRFALRRLPNERQWFRCPPGMQLVLAEPVDM